MMKLALMLLAALPLLADPITVGPIPITGSGYWAWVYGGGIAVSVTALGSDGINSVFVSFRDGNEIPLFIEPPVPTVFGTVSGCPDGTAIINGVVVNNSICSGTTFGFTIDSNGSGLLFTHLYPFGSPIDQADLFGAISI